MAEDKKLQNAKQTYQALLAEINRRDWTCDPDEENLTVRIDVSGDDLPLHFIFQVEADAEIVSMYSPLGITIAEDKRLEVALAACLASNSVVDGNFDYNVGKGRLVYRLTAPFHDHAIEPEHFGFMFDCGCAVVDHYNDRFLALNKGMLSLDDFAN